MSGAVALNVFLVQWFQFPGVDLGEKEYLILLTPGSDTAQPGMEQECSPVWRHVLSHLALVCQALALLGMLEGLLIHGVWKEACRSS